MQQAGAAAAAVGFWGSSSAIKVDDRAAVLLVVLLGLSGAGQSTCSSTVQCGELGDPGGGVVKLPERAVAQHL